MSSDTTPEAPYLSVAEEAAALAARMRAYGVMPDIVARIFAAVALDNASRALPETDPGWRRLGAGRGRLRLRRGWRHIRCSSAVVDGRRLIDWFSHGRRRLEDHSHRNRRRLRDLGNLA